MLTTIKNIFFYSDKYLRRRRCHFMKLHGNDLIYDSTIETFMRSKFKSVILINSPLFLNRQQEMHK